MFQIDYSVTLRITLGFEIKYPVLPSILFNKVIDRTGYFLYEKLAVIFGHIKI